jgi:hypothetical protein
MRNVQLTRGKASNKRSLLTYIEKKKAAGGYDTTTARLAGDTLSKQG